MPIYENFCKTCNNLWDMVQSYEDEPVKICPECSNSDVRRVFSLGYIAVKDCKTLGALAERNNKLLGGKREELIREMKENRKPTFRGVLPSTAEIVPQGDKTPWWRNDNEAVDISLSKMNTEQTEKYVMTGKKPIPTGS